MPKDHGPIGIATSMGKIDLTAYHAAIGKVAVEWASFEHIIDAHIWDLAGVAPEVGSCITANMSNYHARIRALISLARHRGAGEKVIKALNAVASCGGSLAMERARIVHDPVFIGMDDSFAHVPIRLVITADKNPVHELRPIPVKKIESAAEEIITVAKSLTLARTNPEGCLALLKPLKRKP